MTLTYETPGNGGKAELLATITGDDLRSLQKAMVEAAFNVDDWEWVQERMVELLRHPSHAIQGRAAMCLGHIARIHKRLDIARVRPLVVELLETERALGYTEYADDALDDIDMYVNRRGYDRDE